MIRTYPQVIVVQRSNAMSTQRFDDSENSSNDFMIPDDGNETDLNIKLKRRRQIEQLSEEKRLREELGDDLA